MVKLFFDINFPITMKRKREYSREKLFVQKKKKKKIQETSSCWQVNPEFRQRELVAFNGASRRKLGYKFGRKGCVEKRPRKVKLGAILII